MKSYLPGVFTRIAITRLAAIAFFVFGYSLTIHAKDPAQSSNSTIEYSRDSASLIVSYTLRLGEIAEVDGGPSLRIYGDGFAYVHYPVYMTRAGDYGVQLNDTEVLSLLESLAADGVVEFDAEGVRETLREIDRIRRQNEGTMHYVSDQSISVIQINLVSYAPSESPGLQQENLSKTIRWSGLETDARRYADHALIQNLASAESRLRALMERPDMIKLDAQTLQVSPVPGKD